MICALSEGMFEDERQHMRDAASVSLMRDVRKGLAAIRYVAVKQDLTVRSGLLGVARNLQQFWRWRYGLDENN